MPACPACAQPIRYAELTRAIRDWNPWDIDCPHCDARLQAPLLQLGAVLSVALAIGAIALGAYLEVIDVLPSGGMYWFWGVSAVAIVALWACLWPATDFVPKA